MRTAHTKGVSRRPPALLPRRPYVSRVYLCRITPAKETLRASAMALKLEDQTLSKWGKEWETGATAWHSTAVHPSLSKHFHTLLERTSTGCGEDRTKGDQHGPSSIRILVPLCGKSVDMMWFAEAGHEVVGVEFSEHAVKEFFTENNLPFEQEQVGKLVRYKCTDVSKKVELWQGDMFECSRDNVGQFDAVWDRGSMVAVNVGDRERYVDLIISLLVPKGAILMESFDYNQEERLLAPFSIPGPMLQELWGQTCSLQLLETRDMFEENAEIFHKAWGLSRMGGLIYIIQKMS